MARVCLAHDEILDRDVALKVLREQFADEEFVERFKREARSAALCHLNIIQVYDCGETEDSASYIGMKYVPGRRTKNAFRRAGPWTRWSLPRVADRRGPRLGPRAQPLWTKRSKVMRPQRMRLRGRGLGQLWGCPSPSLCLGGGSGFSHNET
jgi:hypothetical protein